MKSNEFVFDYVHVLYYKCHKINPNRGGSYIDSPDCIKNKKQQQIPSMKKKTNAFNTPVLLNYIEIKKYPQIISKNKPFINKYNWEGINFPSEKDEWKKLEKNNVIIALIFLDLKNAKNISFLCFKT